MAKARFVPASRQGVVQRMLVVLGLACLLTMSMAGSASAGISNITVDPKASIVTKTSALVTGKIVCTQGEFHEVTVLVVQASGKVNVEASGKAPVNCTGQVQTWSTIVNVTNGPSTALKKGPASVTYAAVDNGLEYPYQTQNLKLS